MLGSSIEGAGFLLGDVDLDVAAEASRRALALLAFLSVAADLERIWFALLLE